MTTRLTGWVLGVLLLAQGWAWADSSRFADHGNGAITDTKTGLMWQKTDSWLDLKKPMNWYDAVDYVSTKNSQKYAGYNDWRLPTRDELKTLWDSSMPTRSKDEEPTGLPAAFGNGGSYFLWTADERGLNFAWYFGLGQKENYFNLKDSGDLGQGARFVRSAKAE